MDGAKCLMMHSSNKRQYGIMRKSRILFEEINQSNYVLLILHSLQPIARFKAISLLPCPEHHIRIPRVTQSGEEKLTRNPISFRKLDIITRDDMGQQGLDFIDCKESSGTDGE
jgi:hypothetical protein